MSMNDADKWFDALSAEQQAPLRKLRALVLAGHPAIVEEIKWGQPCYSVHKLCVYLAKAKAHVTLGFQQGAHLADPDGLLEGEGKDMRAARFLLGSSIEEVACAALIKAAIDFDQNRFQAK